MFGNHVRRLAPRVAGCRERGVVVANRKFAAGVQVLPLHTRAAPTVVGAGWTTTAGRWRCTNSEEKAPRRWSSTVAVPAEGLTLNVDERVPRVKHRVPQKRASFLLNELRTEQANGKRCELPDMKIGDAVEVTMYANKKAARTTQVRGVLVRKVNRGIDSTILLRDVINGNSVESHIPLFSPLIESVEVMEKAFIYQGKLKGKRVRPARIYYIRQLDQKYYRITGGGGSEY